MKISLNWLKQYLNIHEDIQYIERSLTDIGLEVSHIESFSMINKNLIIGKIISCIQHPNAERLKVTQVDIGNKLLLNIVCGAPNVRIGQKVIVAPVGTILDLAGEELKIKKVKIRGQVSEGMICAEDEIGLSSNHDTIMELDTDLGPGVTVSQYFGTQRDTIVEIDITPNRTDALSHIGVARDLGARLKKNIKYPSIDEKLFSEKNKSIKVKIEDPTLCMRYSGIVIKDIVIKESPIWLKEKLKSIGLTPINNIVDITNFVLQEYGQPLHAFDYDTIADKTIIVKSAKDINTRMLKSAEGKVTGDIETKKETLSQTVKGMDFNCLDNKVRKLSGDEIMICDTKKPLCIAGIIGGKNSCVTYNKEILETYTFVDKNSSKIDKKVFHNKEGNDLKTKNIFLESACFNPIAISKTAKKLGISTDASFRYERGTDPNITITALKRAAEMIVKEANGIIASDIIDIYPKKVEKCKVKLDCKYLNKLVGKEIPKEEIIDILKRLEIGYKEDGDILDLEIPTYRVDVTRAADVVEEILRIYGYNNVEADDNTVQYEYIAPASSATTNSKRKNIIAELLVARGYNEIITNSLTNSEYGKIEHSKWDFPICINPNRYSASNKDKGNAKDKESIDILNPLSSITNSLRTTLIFSGLEVIARNINRGNKHLNLFEFGKIYYKSSGDGNFNIFEEQRLGIWLTGTKDRNFWIKESQDSEFQKLNSIVHGIFQKLKIFINKNISTETKKESGSYTLCFYIENESKDMIAKIGLIEDYILEKFKIQQNVLYGEINWEVVKNIIQKEVIYNPISVFPAVSRDLSLILDKNIIYEEVLEVTKALNDPKIQQISLVDTYEKMLKKPVFVDKNSSKIDDNLSDNKGGNSLQGKKTYTINFKLRDLKKTLKEKEINKTMTKLIRVYESQLGAEIRDK